MKHCYTDCLIISDDDYRTRYDCKVCKKQFYEIKNRTVETRISDSSTFFIKGSPYINCGHCGMTEKLHDARNIRIFIAWEELDQVYAYTADGTRYVKRRYRPKIRTTLGCRHCVALQENETRCNKRPHAFGMPTRIEYFIPNTTNTTKYATKPSYKVVWDGTGYLTTEDNVRLTEYYGPNVD